MLRRLGPPPRALAVEAVVRALRLSRYGGSPEAPSRAGRAALRRELGDGLGLLGRLRAWWALPPRPGRGDAVR